MRILVVDDIGYIRTIVELALEMEGYKTVAASNGNEAFKLLKGDPGISAVICDLSMPGLDGIELIEKCKLEINHLDKDGEYSLPPFILLTGVSDKKKLQQALESGYKTILLKPFDSKKIVEKIREYTVTPKSTSNVERLRAEIVKLKEEIKRKDALIKRLRTELHHKS